MRGRFALVVICLLLDRGLQVVISGGVLVHGCVERESRA